MAKRKFSMLRRTRRRGRRKLRRTRAIGRRSRALGIYRGPMGISNTKRVRLTYGTFFEVPLNALEHASYVYLANGMYDPDYTGTGHQPKYFDQWGALYKRYLVFGSKIYVENGDNSEFGGPKHVHCHISTNGDPVKKLGQYVSSHIENKGSYTKSLITGSKNVVKRKLNVRKFAKVRNLRDELNWQAGTNADPEKKIYFIVEWNTDALLSASFRVYVRIIYDVLFMEPTDPGSS